MTNSVELANGEAVDNASAPVVVHMTSVHPAADNRIHARQCASLAAAGFDVRLVVLGPAPDVPAPGVKVISAGPRMPRLKRMTVGALRVVLAARAQHPEIIHIHDPELMLVVPLVRLMGSKVVVDLHEDPTLQIQDKVTLPKAARRLSILGYRAVLAAVRPLVSLFVVAWPHPKAPAGPDKVIEVRNYPRREEFTVADPVPYEQRPPLAVSVGSNGRKRSYVEMIEAARLLGDRATVNIVGSTTPEDLPRTLAAEIEQSGVRLTPRQEHQGVAEAIHEAKVGLCLLYPTRQYVLAEPTKLFEYLSVGLPVVGTDMGPTREVLTRHRCGILVDPKDPKAIAEAIATIVEDPELANTFRKRALEASENYTWEEQIDRLTKAYRRLLGLSVG